MAEPAPVAGRSIARPAIGGRQQLLTFRVDDELYALAAPGVREVVRPLRVARVPQGPASLLGLANLRGEVLPVASVRRLLHRPAAAAAAAARVIVVDWGAPVGLLVDEIGALVLAADDDIDREGAELSAAPGELLLGLLHLPGQGGTAKIIDLARLLAGGFARQPRHVGTVHAAATAPDAGDVVSVPDLIALISFDLAGQEFALPLEQVREIVALPATMSALPRSDSAVLGVMELRGELLPLISLRALLGLAAGDPGTGRAKVVVALVGDAIVGLVADRTRAILRVAPASLDAVPAIVARRAAGEAALQAICRLEHGRLVSVLATDRLFREDLVRHTAPEHGDGSAAGDAPAADEEQFVVFRIADEEYGLPIAAVDEVTRVPETLSRLPKAPDFVEGVMNLRGIVLPAIDQRRRFDLPPIARNDRQRVVVVTSEGSTIGLIVDSVSRVLRVPCAAIVPAPDLSDQQSRLVSRVAGVGDDNRLLLLLDPKELLDRTERGMLAGMDASDGARPTG